MERWTAEVGLTCGDTGQPGHPGCWSAVAELGQDNEVRAVDDVVSCRVTRRDYPVADNPSQSTIISPCVTIGWGEVTCHSPVWTAGNRAASEAQQKLETARNSVPTRISVSHIVYRTIWDVNLVVSCRLLRYYLTDQELTKMVNTRIIQYPPSCRCTSQHHSSVCAAKEGNNNKLR